MGLRKTIAILGLIGIAAGGIYVARDDIASRIGLQKPPYKVVQHCESKTPFLVDTKTGVQVEIYQGRIGPQVGDIDYLVKNVQELPQLAKKSFSGLEEDSKLELTVNGLREISEDNRMSAIKQGMDYCSTRTEAMIVKDRLEANAKEGYGAMKKKVLETYGTAKDLIERYKPDDPNAKQQGDTNGAD